MEENVDQPLQSTKENSPKNKENKRSVSYPVKTFDDIFSFVEKIHSTYGGSSYLTNVEIAGVVGLATATIKQPLSTAQQYGLLENKHGVGYKVTSLFTNILLWENENDKLASVIESLKSPELFKKMFEDYIGQVVPSSLGLKNKLQREYALKDTIAEMVADIFLQNLTQYNLLNTKNVLISSPAFALANRKPDADTSSSNVDVVVEVPKEKPQTKQQANNDVIPEEFVEILIPMKSAPVNARLILLRNYTPEDLQRISKFVTALE